MKRMKTTEPDAVSYKPWLMEWIKEVFNIFKEYEQGDKNPIDSYVQ